MLLSFVPIRHITNDFRPFLNNSNFNTLQKASSLISARLNLNKSQHNLITAVIASKLLRETKFPNKSYLSNLKLTLDMCKEHFTSSEIINNISLLFFSPVKLKTAINFFLIFGIKLKPHHILHCDRYIKFNLKYLCAIESFNIQNITHFYDSITLKTNLPRINFDYTDLNLLSVAFKMLTSLSRKHNVYVSNAFEEAIRMQQIKLLPIMSDFLNKLDDYSIYRAHLYIHFISLKNIKKLNPKNCQLVLNFLIKDLKMNDEQIILAPNIMLTSFQEIIRRLTLLVKDYGVKMLLNRECLSIISSFHFLKLKNRLDKLKLSGYDLISNFQIRHTNDSLRATIVIVIRLSVHKDRTKLNIDDNALKRKIIKNYSLHPRAKQFDHFNALEVLDYLIINEIVDIYQIVNTPYVVLYTVSCIKNAINEAKKNNYYFEFEKSSYFLEYILYIANKKKENVFTT